MFKWPAVITLVAGLILAALVGPWAYDKIQRSNRAMEQVDFLMNQTPPDVIVPEPQPAVEAKVPALQVIHELTPDLDKLVPPEADPVPEIEPAHIYTPSCAPEVPMQAGKRGANLRFAWADRAGIHPCPQRSMDHTAPRPLAPGKYKLPYGSVTVFPRKR